MSVLNAKVNSFENYKIDLMLFFISFFALINKKHFLVKKLLKIIS